VYRHAGSGPRPGARAAAGRRAGRRRSDGPPLLPAPLLPLRHVRHSLGAHDRDLPRLEPAPAAPVQRRAVQPHAALVRRAIAQLLHPLVPVVPAHPHALAASPVRQRRERAEQQTTPRAGPGAVGTCPCQFTSPRLGRSSTICDTCRTGCTARARPPTLGDFACGEGRGVHLRHMRVRLARACRGRKRLRRGRTRSGRARPEVGAAGATRNDVRDGTGRVESLVP
jgi:hypothetical protein